MFSFNVYKMVFHLPTQNYFMLIYGIYSCAKLTHEVNKNKKLTYVKFCVHVFVYVVDR